MIITQLRIFTPADTRLEAGTRSTVTQATSLSAPCMMSIFHAFQITTSLLTLIMIYTSLGGSWAEDALSTTNISIVDLLLVDSHILNTFHRLHFQPTVVRNVIPTAGLNKTGMGGIMDESGPEVTSLEDLSTMNTTPSDPAISTHRSRKKLTAPFQDQV